MQVLVTGGCGYIGSHACVALQQAGHTPIILDNFSNSKPAIAAPLTKLMGADPIIYQGDIRDDKLLERIFTDHRIDAVMHFAGLKAVGESIIKPIEYYDNNVNGTLVLLAAMEKAEVNGLIFSSSATVYGDPVCVPIDEEMPTGNTTNPYGTSKYMVERCLADVVKATPKLSVTLLRYFNPVGAHPSGLMGEDPQGIPNNLMPFITQVAIGRRDSLSVFGNDYSTTDGTGVRDYIHVMDLVSGHVAALEKHSKQAGLHCYNLGTGQGTSVLQMVDAMAAVSQREIPIKIEPRREGDIAMCYADATKAEQALDWVAKYSIDDMAKHSWNWQLSNPNGYEIK